MSGFFNYFGTIIIISMFWSFLITSTIHFMPASERNIIIQFDPDEGNYQNVTTDSDEIAREFQASLQSQRSFGIVDLAALALYSGNIFLDLAVNFFFAIPEIFSLLFYAIFQIIRVNEYLQLEIILWMQGLFAIVATTILVRFLLAVRSQSLGAV